MDVFGDVSHAETCFMTFDSLLELAAWAAAHDDLKDTYGYGKDIWLKQRKQSFSKDYKFYGPSIRTVYDFLRLGNGPIPEMVEEVNKIVNDLSEEVTPPASLTARRKRGWGASGYQINMARVNRGQLNSAWRRIERRELQMTQGHIATIVLPLEYNWMISQEEIAYCAASTLALVTALEHKGVRCHLMALKTSHNAWHEHPRGYKHIAMLIQLKGPDQDWNIFDAVGTMHRSVVRRLLFRFIEKHGLVADVYGYPANSASNFDERLKRYIGVFGYSQEQLIRGVYNEEGVRDRATAIDWVNAQLAAFDLAYSIT